MLSPEKIKEIQDEMRFYNSENADVFSALGDPSRYKMFLVLLKHDDICVSDFAKIMNFSIPAASQQLAVLEKAGLVIKERMGQMVCYMVNSESDVVKNIIDTLDLQGKKKKRWGIF